MRELGRVGVFYTPTFPFLFLVLIFCAIIIVLPLGFYFFSMTAMQLAIKDIKEYLESDGRIFINYSSEITHKVRPLIKKQIREQLKKKRK